MEENKTMKFEIYYDCFSPQQGKMIQKTVGIGEGISFQNACYNYSNDHQEFAEELNLDKLTYKGYELYGNWLLS